jgi:hypothetical protein
MTDNRKAGWALIMGSTGGVVTMAIHPTGAGTMRPYQVGHLVWVSGIAHTLALVSVLLLFLGACGLTRHLAAKDRIAFAAVVTYGFAAVAVMTAGSVSGWVIPGILRLMARDVPANEGTWRIAVATIFQINQAMAGIYSVAAAAAIVLWSACCLRQGKLSRGMAMFGCVTSPLIALLIFVGHLRLDVHGMAAVMLSEVIWFVGMGVGLMRHEGAVSGGINESRTALGWDSGDI